MKLTDIEKAELTRYFEYNDYSKYFQNKRFLITGSKGILGTGIIKWLLFLNQRKNTCISIIASTRTPDIVPDYIENGDDIEFCCFGDENNYCANQHIDYIIHTASPTSNNYHLAHPYSSLHAIIKGTESALEVCKQHKDCVLMYISSEEVYGLYQGNDEIEEKYVGAIDSLTGRSCYPLGKKVSELLCYNSFLEDETDIRIVRPSGIQGLFQKYEEPRFFNELLRTVVEKNDLIMKSGGLTEKSMVYSLDAISAIFAVLIFGSSGEAYNVSNMSTYMSMRDLAEIIFKRFNPKSSIIYPDSDSSVKLGYLPYRKIPLSIKKISELDWKPLTTLEDIYRIDIERFIESGIDD